MNTFVLTLNAAISVISDIGTYAQMVRKRLVSIWIRNWNDKKSKNVCLVEAFPQAMAGDDSR